MVEEQSLSSVENVLRAVTKKLDHDLGIAHTTIQIEVRGCEPNDIFCLLKVANDAAGTARNHRAHAADDLNVSHEH